MQSFDHWLAFAAATTVLVLIPGPTVALVISYALGMGRKSTLATVVGVALGDLTAITASMVGLGAVLAASATLFNLVKIGGAIYLVYLGIKLWRSPVRSDMGSIPKLETSTVRIFFHAYVVTALNPKGIIFFVAFVPQFLVASEPLVPQIILLEATFVGLAALNATFYALLANSARRAIQKSTVKRAVNRTGGSLLVGAGIFTALWQKN